MGTAQKVTFIWKQPDSTFSLNNHVAKIIAKGPYSGLLVQPTSPASMKLDLTAGYAFSIEGVKIEEQGDVKEEFVEISPAHPTRQRKDLVIMRHQYIADVTVPAGNPATYHVLTGVVPGDDITEAEPPYGDMQEYDIPLAEIWVPGGAVAITESEIRNLRRTPTTAELADIVAEALYLSVGNFAFEGWDPSAQQPQPNLNLLISAGRGLLCGRVNTSLDEYILTTLRPREVLRPDTDPGPTNDPDYGKVAENLTLHQQPDYPSKLRLTITTTTNTYTQTINILGLNEVGDEILEQVEISQGTNDEQTYETVTTWSEVAQEGIDCPPIDGTFIVITDKPVHYIYAVGTPTGVPHFRAEMNPAYEPKCEELLIAIVETDETGIISIDDLSLSALVPYLDDMSDQCDGARKTFYLDALPVPDSEWVILDGLVLMKDEPHGKGYSLNGKELILGANVPAPDGVNTYFYAKYMRHN